MSKLALENTYYLLANIAIIASAASFVFRNIFKFFKNYKIKIYIEKRNHEEAA